jgi:hypothetical protein
MVARNEQLLGPHLVKSGLEFAGKGQLFRLQKRCSDDATNMDVIILLEMIQKEKGKCQVDQDDQCQEH